jgi:ABC-type Zn uptake system ZnuABC Zn-binding protein ZnuA
MSCLLKRKRPFLIVAIILISSCFIPYSNSEEVSTTIICTNSILADFTKNILKENVKIDYIMPAGACPMHYDTNPSDVSKIISADIIISLGNEPWLTDLLENTDNSNFSEIKCFQLGEWNIPSGAKKYVKKIRDELSIILPSMNKTIQANAKEYLEYINISSENLKDMIKTKGFTGRNIISMQWHKDFLEWLGLNVTYYYGPPERLSTQDIFNVTKAASVGDICAIIDNLQSGTDFGANIASKSGSIHIIFSNFPGAIPNTDTYIDMITYNSQQLINGITTYEFKKGEIAELENKVSNLEIERNIISFGIMILAIFSCIMIILYKKK